MKFDYSLQNNNIISIKEKTKISFISISEILYLQCNGYLTTLYLTDRESISISKLLKDFEKELGKYGFLRANHNTLVNTRYISALQLNKQGKSIYIRDVEVKISRRKYYLFQDFL